MIRFQWDPAAQVLHCTDAPAWRAFQRSCPGDWVCRAFIWEQEQYWRRPTDLDDLELVGAEHSSRSAVIARAKALRYAYSMATYGKTWPNM